MRAARIGGCAEVVQHRIGHGRHDNRSGSDAGEVMRQPIFRRCADAVRWIEDTPSRRLDKGGGLAFRGLCFLRFVAALFGFAGFLVFPLACGEPMRACHQFG